jgi:hypothetical protein
MTTKKGYVISKKPAHEKLSWPGLKAEDHLSRVVTRVVKEAKETRETNAWAQNQIARVLNHVSPSAAVRLIYQEVSHRRKTIRGREVAPQLPPS